MFKSLNCMRKMAGNSHSEKNDFLIFLYASICGVQQNPSDYSEQSESLWFTKNSNEVMTRP